MGPHLPLRTKSVRNLKKRIRNLRKKRKLSLHQLNCQRKKAKRRKNRPKRKVLKTRNGTKNLKRKRVRTSKNVRRRRNRNQASRFIQTERCSHQSGITSRRNWTRAKKEKASGRGTSSSGRNCRSRICPTSSFCRSCCRR